MWACVTALVLLGGAAPRAPAGPCPDTPTMQAACGSARAAGLGECLACLLQRFPSCHNSTDEDAWCLAGNSARPNATLAWKQRVGGELDGSPAVSPDGSVVYVGSDDHFLYALDSRTGNTLWKYSKKLQWFGISRSSPVVSPDGKVIYAASIVGADDGNLVAVTSEGALKWTWLAPQTSGGLILAPPATSKDGGLLFLGSQDVSAAIVDPACFLVTSEDAATAQVLLREREHRHSHLVVHGLRHDCDQ